MAVKEGTNNLGSPWSEGDDQFLRDNVKTMTYQQMADKLGRNYESVRGRCRMLGLRKRSARVRADLDSWNQAQDDYIEANIQVMTYGDIGKAINRTAEAVQQRVRSLGLAKRRHARDKAKYAADEAFMQANYRTMTHQQMADLLGLDVMDVSRICTRRGFSKEARWTDKDDCLLVALKASGMSFKEVATHFPTRTYSAVRQHHLKLTGKLVIRTVIHNRNAE